MDNYSRLKSVIASFSGNERHITVPKIYLEITGDFNTAALLNQMIFWSDKTKRKDGFFYKTYLEWEDELTLSEYQVRRAVKSLKDKGLVETKLKKANGSPTIHYKINMDVLSDSIIKKLKNRNLTNLSNDTKESEETLTVDDSLDDYINKDTVDKLEDIPYKEIVDYLNEKAGRQFRLVDKTKTLIKARWNEGQRLDDFKKVVDIKIKHANDSNNLFNETYLQPSTLFGNKFDEYRNQFIASKPKNVSKQKTWEEQLIEDGAV